MYEILGSGGKFQKVEEMAGKKKNKTITEFQESQLQRFLLSLKKKGLLSGEVYKSIKPVGSVPGRMYGLPKTHKVSCRGEVPPVRPILSAIGSYNYQVAKYLNSLLVPLIPNEY